MQEIQAIQDTVICNDQKVIGELKAKNSEVNQTSTVLLNELALSKADVKKQKTSKNIWQGLAVGITAIFATLTIIYK